METKLLIKSALDRAAQWHRGQKRKYPGADVPYISHVAGVSVVLARHGFDDEVVAAGVLHDVIEDCEVTHGELATLFGTRVADLVQAVTEPPKRLPWEERKRQFVERFALATWDVQGIAIADKIDNFTSIVLCARDHGDPWTMFHRGRDIQIKTFETFARVAAALPAHPILREFEEALAAVRTVG